MATRSPQALLLRLQNHSMALNWIRRMSALALGAALVPALAGCSPYPDGLVARRAEGLVATALCPATGAPQVIGVRVWSLDEGAPDLDASSDPKRTFLWAATVPGGDETKAVESIALFSTAPALTIRGGRPVTLDEDTWLEVDIETLTTMTHEALRFGDLAVGEAHLNGTALPESEARAESGDSTCR